MREFRIDGGVGNVAARGHVEIVQLDAVLERHLDMAAIAVRAEFVAERFTERNAREHGDAVIALLPVDRVMHIAKLLERLRRETGR